MGEGSWQWLVDKPSVEKAVYVSTVLFAGLSFYWMMLLL